MMARLLLAVGLLGCGGAPRDGETTPVRTRPSPTQRAWVIGLVTLAGGVSTVASSCPHQTGAECAALSARAGAVVLSVSVAAAAQAWLAAADDEVAQAAESERWELERLRALEEHDP
jgi:hypothetical protein